MARVLLGVSGGVAAYKSLELVRLAVRAGHSVRVIQTPASRRFVGQASFAALTGAPVLSGEFELDPARGSFPGEPAPVRFPISHLALVQRADAYLIAPASANTIARLAHGLADSLLSTAALAASCPVAVAPAMNDRMYRHAATQANLEILRARGVRVIPPGEGELASHGEHGAGRLPDPAQLLEVIEEMVAPARRDLEGVRVLITAGGTREPIDSVRYLGNRSSGRMGYALAARARARGAEVTVLSANVALEAPDGVRCLSVTTAAELAEACASELPLADVLLMAAAVADWRPASPAPGKLKKHDHTLRSLALEPTEDILAGLAGHRSPGQLVVGFAAEHGEQALRHGREKLERKGLDAIVVNDISRDGIGFEGPENEVVILTRDGRERSVPRTLKERVADAILEEVALLLCSPSREPQPEEDDGAARTAALGA